jgi:hypothetical protein
MDKDQALAAYRERYAGREDASPGWDALDERLRAVYGDQTPRHWGTVVKYMLGGPDPIDGTSAYECRDGGREHLHFCTYGYSALYYDEERAGQAFSGYGFEMTFRLATSLPAPEEPWWVLSLLQNLARYVFKSGRWFEPNHWIAAGGPLRANSETALVGLAFLTDPVLGRIPTPHGQVEFLQAFGITAAELERCKAEDSAEGLIEEHRRANPLLITDLARRD